MWLLELLLSACMSMHDLEHYFVQYLPSTLPAAHISELSLGIVIPLDCGSEVQDA